MSQSPLQSDTDPNSLLRYQQGWKALNRLLHTDRSFSGGERNCAFLNTGANQFATVSSVSGLDFLDDGRAVAACDWDFDGRLDLWLTARTAPRLRFVRNTVPNKNHFVALYLAGDAKQTNLDAIGARVELYTSGGTKLIKTRHAGDGFITQSSGWIHFGLGDEDKLDRIVVRWPGGRDETFREIETDQFLILEQGRGAVKVWTPPDRRKPINVSSPVERVATETARIVLPMPLPLPRVMATLGAEANARTAAELQFSRPTLINVWSSSCPLCIQELANWGTEFDTLGSKLSLIALNADPEPESAQRIMEQLSLPFDWHWAAENAISNLDLFQRSITDRWDTMPVPCSFLLDKNGDVFVVYKGAVDLTQVLADCQLLEVSAIDRRKECTPFAGKWSAPPPLPDPLRVSSQFIDHAQIDEAAEYLLRYVSKPRPIQPTRLADVEYILAALLDAQNRDAESIRALMRGRDANPNDARIRIDLAKRLASLGKLPEAEGEFTEALRITPRDANVRRDLGICLLQQDKAMAAAKQFAQVLKLRPKDSMTQFHLATALRKLGRWKQAIRFYDEAFKNQPKFILAANNLAWLLATRPEDELRNGKRAVEISLQICEQTGFNSPELLDTLAAAYAESGDFDQAISTIERALKLPGLQDAARRGLLQRAELYRSSQPLREN